VLVIIIVMSSVQGQSNKEHNTSYKVKIVIKYLKWTCSPYELYRLLLIVCALELCTITKHIHIPPCVPPNIDWENPNFITRDQAEKFMTLLKYVLGKS
jgi:hypothetical protein